MLAITTPYPQFFDFDGSPLDQGFLYFGSIDQDPVANPIPIFWDRAGTIPAPQPVRTLNGYPARNGSPALVFVGSDYSLTAKTKIGVTVFYAPRASDNSVSLAADLRATTGAGQVGYLSGPGYPGDSVGAALVGHGQSIDEIKTHVKDGFVIGGRFVGAPNGESLDTERAKLTNETARIYNTSQRHIVLSDGTREVVIAMTSDGGVRIIAFAGTPDENTLTIPRASAIPVIQGSRQNNQALTSTLAALQSLGLVKDQTT